MAVEKIITRGQVERFLKELAADAKDSQKDYEGDDDYNEDWWNGFVAGRESVKDLFADQDIFEHVVKERASQRRREA